MLIKLEQCKPEVKEMEQGIAALRISVNADALAEEVSALEERPMRVIFGLIPKPHSICCAL